MNQLIINGIACQARLGVKPAERRRDQAILVDVALGLDMEPAANTDDLELTIDYFKLVKLVQKTVRDHEANLVETVADHLCRSILTHPLAQEVSVRVYKVPRDLEDDIENVVVEMTRSV